MNFTHADIQLALLHSAPGCRPRTRAVSRRLLANRSSEMNMPSFARPGLLCVTKTNGGSIGEPVPLLKTNSTMASELAAT